MKKLPLPSSVQQLLTAWTDLIFPPSSTERLLRTIHKRDLDTLFTPQNFHTITYLARYSDPVIQAAITENKFHAHPQAAYYLGHLLDLWAQRHPSPTLFIAIPLGKQRLRQRGHNQVETIIKTGLPNADLGSNILCRTQETTPQSELSRNARLKNVRDAFSFIGKKEYFNSYTQVVLVDDVVTTGATMLAARAALAPHLPPKTTLTCLAIAH